MQDPVAQHNPPAQRRLSAPIVLLGLLILGYGIFFSAYSLQRHNTLNTSPADLSAVDQAMWNTVHGRFFESTVGASQVPRMAEHFEPILVPLSLVYLAWNDVRAILIIQTLMLALGALPVFWISRRAFADQGRRAEWLALAFSLAYLMFPALQAANVAGFHAETLFVTPLLFAFWYGTEGRWRLMWAWAAVALLVNESLPALTALLGLYFVVSDPVFRGASRSGVENGTLGRRLRSAFSGGAKHGLALFVISAAWFAIGTFVIVARPAGLDLGSGGLVLLREPARLEYLKDLFGSTGWLALLAPEIWLIGLPVLAGNTLSSLPARYSGAGTYSAALVPVFIVAAIFGGRRLLRFLERQIPFRLSPKITNTAITVTLVAAWLVFSSVSAQVGRGWTPLAQPFQWPAYTAHAATLARLTGQIPADAAVSATAGVHPHLAHREKVYVFPELGDAEYVLVDVTGKTGMGAGELKSTVERLVSGGGYGIVDGADGYLLLAKGKGGTAVPPDFYTFARAGSAQPAVPLQAQFGRGLQFLGYDVVDDPRSRLTHFRLYFKRISDEPLPADLALGYTSRDQAGAVVDDSGARPMPATVWYPPTAWAEDETVVLQTEPSFLPRAFAPVLTVTSGGQTVKAELAQAASPLPASQEGIPVTVEVAPDGSLRLPGLARRNGVVSPYEGPLYPIDSAEASFAGEDWTVRLREFSAPLGVAPGGQMPVLLYWQAARPAPQDYEVTLELRDATGNAVAKTSGQPTWFVTRPASTWQAKDDGVAGVIDAHSLQVPVDLEPGRYDLVVGWYDKDAGKRLPRVEGTGARLTSGNRLGNEFVLGAVTVDPLVGPRPDACCAAAKECCASNE